MKKTIIVTGGSRGIGREIVIQLAKSGYQVVLNYCKSEKLAQDLKKELAAENIYIETVKADVSKREEVKQLVNYTLQKFGKIDVLVNNAGIDEVKLFTDITDDNWNEMINVNLYSVFCVTQEVVKEMIKNKFGCIINISSVWGLVGASCETHYAVSKAGIDGMTKSLAKELGPSGIRVNSIAPGCIQTDMNKGLTQEDMIQLKNETPLGKLGLPIDIAKCIKWLVEDEFTTGQVISINGGWVIT